MPSETPFSLNASDGYPIAAKRFTPDQAPHGVVLVVPAMGAAQHYYAPFARWLARQGWQVLTFDYRGMGASRRGGLRGFKATIDDWAKLDCAAALAEASKLAEGKPVLWIGHSLGGQILGLVPNLHLANRVLNIAAGSGYWRVNAPQLRRRVLFMWYGVMPAMTALFVFFPGKRLRMVGDLPLGVIRQWRQWCLHREYAVGVLGDAARSHYAAVSTPIASVSFTDDELMSARSIEALHEFYAGAPRTMQRYAPQELGLKRIGHFGFFRAEHEETLWQRLVRPELLALGARAALGLPT